MNQKKNKSIAGWGDYVTSTISVTLVLFILGLVGVINITFDGINRQVKERLGFTVVLTDSVAPSIITNLQKECKTAPYISTYKYLSSEDVLNEETGGEGDNLIDICGVNPYAPMFEVNVKAAYANVDSISKIVKQWENRDFVQEVTVNTEMIGNLNRNAHVLNMILIIIAGALLLISFVLINNTVRLTVYSRRFLIHTMKLVGAKGSFIRRPFLINNAIEGVIAGCLSAGILAGLVAWGQTLDADLTHWLPWCYTGIVLGALPLLGIIICTVAALFATNRYLHQCYDDMFN
jgi:cell division transport system permease protein